MFRMLLRRHKFKKCCKQVAPKLQDEVDDDYMDVNLTDAEVRSVELSVEASCLNQIYSVVPTDGDVGEFKRHIARMNRQVRIAAERLEGNRSRSRFIKRMRHMIDAAKLTGKKRSIQRRNSAAIDTLHGELNAYLVEVQEEMDELRYNKYRKLT